MRYTPGTEIQLKNGRIVKKLPNGRWIGRGRFIYMEKIDKSIDSEQRVFHLDGDKANDEPKNLVAIRFGGPVYHLEHSRLVYVPHKLTQNQKRVLVKI